MATPDVIKQAAKHYGITVAEYKFYLKIGKELSANIKEGMSAEKAFNAAFANYSMPETENWVRIFEIVENKREADKKAKAEYDSKIKMFTLPPKKKYDF